MTQDHEITGLYKARGCVLSDTLSSMLNEHYTHQTERRGCGYTQATRLLSTYVNVPRESHEYTDLKLFADYDSQSLKKIQEQKNSYQLDISDWHNLDQNPVVQRFIEESQPSEFRTALENVIQFQSLLRTLAVELKLEESKLLNGLIEDIVLPKTPENTAFVSLPHLHEKPKVGSCPMAEQFFLKIAHRRILRQGELNIFVDDQQQPLLMEKMNMGDNHSCISLQPLLMNGVRLPAGSLFSVDYDRDLIQQKTPNKEYRGYVIPYSAIQGFWFLRFTTLAVSPENRKRAFTTHFEQQVANGLFSPGTTELSQLVEVARSQTG